MTASLRRSVLALTGALFACSHALPPEPAAQPVIEPAAAPIEATPHYASCLDVLDTAALGLPADQLAGLPLVIMAAGEALSPADVFGDAHVGEESGRVQADRQARCVLSLATRGTPTVTTERGPKRRERSFYQDRVVTEDNPDYYIAKRKLMRVEKEARAAQKGAFSVGDPLLDLIGLASTAAINVISDRAGMSDLGAAEAELARLSPKRITPIYEAYYVDVQPVHVSKTADLRATLRDRATGAWFEADLQVSQQASFEQIDRLRAEDKDYAVWQKRSVDAAMLSRYGRLPPWPDAASLRQALAGGAMERGTGPTRAPIALRAPSSAAETVVEPAAGPVADRAITIRAGSSALSGVVLAPYALVTSLSALQGHHLVEVDLGDGVRRMAVLERSDPALDLALIRLPVRGPVRRMASRSDAASPLPACALAGVPLEAAGDVVGICLGADAGAHLGVGGLRRFLSARG